MHFVRNIKFVIICFFIIFIFTQSKAEIKIVFVEMDKLMRESKVGKSLVTQLAKADNDNNKIFEKTKLWVLGASIMMQIKPGHLGLYKN